MATSRAGRPRMVLGVTVTPQAIVLVLAVLGVATLVGLAVLSWLERMA